MSVSDLDGHIEQHIPRLRRYARALTGERAAADDPNDLSGIVPTTAIRSISVSLLKVLR